MAENKAKVDTSEGKTGGKGWRNKKNSKSNKQPPPGSNLSEQTQPIQPKGPVKATLPKPNFSEENAKRQDKTQTKDESLFKEAIFSSERVLKPTTREIHFTPSFTGYTPTINAMYLAYKNEKRKQFSKEFPIELLRYYGACAFWLRAIGIKATTGVELTDEEDRVFQALETKKLNIPEPMYLALKALGTTSTKTGDKLVPDFPPLPHTVVNNVPGSCGVISAANHNIYEELPVIGPTIENMRQRTHGREGRQYASVFAPRNTTANKNLQGFSRIGSCREEMIQTLNDVGINANDPFINISNTGINFSVLSFVSEYLGCTETFKIMETTLLTLPETGSVAQTVMAVPVVAELTADTHAEDTYVQMQAMTAESAVAAGVSEIFGLNQTKEDFPHPEAWRGTSVWCALDFPAEQALIGQLRANRNERRNLPARYHDRVFYAAGDTASDYRLAVVNRLVHAGT